MDQLQSALASLKLWQFSLVVSGLLLALGFTGGIPFTEVVLTEGREIAAMVGGIIFFVGAAVLRYIPPPETRERNNRSSIAISPTQLALVAQIREWTDFDVAAKLPTDDSGLEPSELQTKNTALRLELATLQGLLMRRIDETTGRHQVKVRADETTWIPNG